MKHISLLFFFGLTSMLSVAQTVYLLPGLGVDQRVFTHLDFPDEVKVVYLDMPNVTKGQSFESYAQMVSECIDTGQPFLLVGVSLGGMVAMKMADYVKPEAVVLISSLSSSDELPGRYRLLNYFPVHWCVGRNSLKLASAAFPVVSPLDSTDTETYSEMMLSANPGDLRQHIGFISGLQYDRLETIPIYEIHGDKDPVLPIRKKKHVDYVIKGGKHKLTMTHSDELNAILEEIIKKAID